MPTSSRKRPASDFSRPAFFSSSRLRGDFPVCLLNSHNSLRRCKIGTLGSLDHLSHGLPLILAPIFLATARPTFPSTTQRSPWRAPIRGILTKLRTNGIASALIPMPSSIRMAERFIQLQPRVLTRVASHRLVVVCQTFLGSYVV
jgi:hypothetical protein